MAYNNYPNFLYDNLDIKNYGFGETNLKPLLLIKLPEELDAIQAPEVFRRHPQEYYRLQRND